MSTHWSRTLVVGAGIVGAVATTGCDRKSSLETERSEQAAEQEEVGETYSELIDYRAKAREKLAEASKKIDDLAAESASMNDPAKKTTDEQLNNLRQQHASILAQLDGMRADSPEAFEAAKNTMDARINDFERSLDAMDDEVDSKK